MLLLIFFPSRVASLLALAPTDGQNSGEVQILGDGHQSIHRDLWRFTLCVFIIMYIQYIYNTHYRESLMMVGWPKTIYRIPSFDHGPWRPGWSVPTLRISMFDMCRRHATSIIWVGGTDGGNGLAPKYGVSKGDIPTKYGLVCYSTSNLCSWNSHWNITVAKHTENYGKIHPFLIGKSTISTGPFSSSQTVTN